jgi:hypothetical protein
MLHLEDFFGTNLCWALAGSRHNWVPKEDLGLLIWNLLIFLTPFLCVLFCIWGIGQCPSKNNTEIPIKLVCQNKPKMKIYLLIMEKNEQKWYFFIAYSKFRTSEHLNDVCSEFPPAVCQCALHHLAKLGLIMLRQHHQSCPWYGSSY